MILRFSALAPPILTSLLVCFLCERNIQSVASTISGSILSPQVDDIVVVDFEGKLVEGCLRPSSDTPTHQRLFKGFTGIRSVVHTHSRNAVAFAQAGRGIPCLGSTHADYFYGEVPVTRAMTAEQIESAYEWETGNVIVERFSRKPHPAKPGPEFPRL
jgi:L-ribulose-5-phosphate 4-epimerase